MTFTFVQLNIVVTVFLLAASISCHIFWHFSDLYYPLTCSVFHLGSCLICHKSIHASAFQVILLEIVFIFGFSVVISMWYHINGPGFSNHHFSFFPFIITWWGTCWKLIFCAAWFPQLDKRIIANFMLHSTIDQRYHGIPHVSSIRCWFTLVLSVCIEIMS